MERVNKETHPLPEFYMFSATRLLTVLCLSTFFANLYGQDAREYDPPADPELIPAARRAPA